MRRFLGVAALAVLLGGCSQVGLLGEASNAASHTLCMAAFVSHVDPQDALDKELMPEPGMGLVGGMLRYDIDTKAQEVRSTLAGGFASRAVYRAGRGCTSVFDDKPVAALTPPPAAPALQPDIAGPDMVTTDNPALARALDAAFAERQGQAPRATAAAVVVQHGRVIAERYARGYGIDTPLSGHSMAKSIVNALIGVLVRDGRMDVAAKVAAPEWTAPGDPHRAITVDNLMRMTGGIGWDEGAGPSRATHMWYTQADDARFAAGAVLKDRPGTAWGYSSQGYMLLSRLVGQKIGGGPQGVSDFAAREIFAPLGMHRVTIQFDEAGTMMGAWSILATPRDWARFGLLYLHDGMAGGRRILPEGWVRYSTTPSLGGGYGAGFWLNVTDAPVPERGFPFGMPHAPADAYFARGYMGQYIVIVPSADLVVVRMGFSHDDGGDIGGTGRLVRDVIAALRQTALR